MAATNINAIDYFSPAKFVVSTVAGEGSHSTIATAISAASSGDTIVIMPGTFTENLSLKAGVNLCAFGSDSSLNNTGNVNITGKCTFTGAGTVTIYGIELQTNSDYLLAVTGSAASIVNLNNCYLNCSNNTGISHTSSVSSSQVNLNHCTGNIGTTAITLYVGTTTGNFNVNFSYINNSGASTLASSSSAGGINLFSSYLFIPVTISSTGLFGISQCIIDTSATNTTTINCGGSGNGTITNSAIISGSASSVTVADTIQLNNVVISSTNTNALTGAGTIDQFNVMFAGSSHKCNVTTQGNGGAAFGLTQGTAPSAGCIGEQIRATGSAVSMSNGTPKTVATLNLTAGIWDLCFTCQGVGSGSNITLIEAGFNTTTNAFTGNLGDDTLLFIVPTAVQYVSQSVSGYRVTLSSSTAYYAVAQLNFGSGTATTYGRASATRVG